MVPLTSAKIIRYRLSLPDDDGVNSSIASALNGTTAYLETKLRTSFDRDEATDWFCVTSRSPSYQGTLRLLLSNGFLFTDNSHAITVTLHSSLGDTNGSSVTPLKVIKDRGVIILEQEVPSTEYEALYYRVSYSYGFLDLDEVPTWLQEVALAYTIKILSMQQVNDSKNELSNIYKFVTSHGTELLDSHLRHDPFAIKSMM